MIRKDIEEFAVLLEINGFDGALQLILNDLLPIAQKHHISLLASAKRYVNVDEEQDTSFYRLGIALGKISNQELQELDIHRPL